MTNTQPYTDKAAIGLSFLCALHCLAVPLIIVLFPSLASLKLNNEAFHLWMLIAVIPTSIYALTLGCKQHKRTHLIAVGILGISCLILAVALEGWLLGEAGEKTLSLMGACIIAYGHFKNYRLCQHHNNCNCSAEK